VVKAEAAVTYHHLALARHSVLEADGLACESFYPGLHALRAVAAPDLARLVALLPGLAAVLDGADPAKAYGPRARPLAAGPQARRFLGAARAGQSSGAGQGAQRVGAAV
jgi:hypothetical protein